MQVKHQPHQCVHAICNGSLGNSTETEDITFSLSSIAGVGTVAIDSGSLVINTRPSNGADVEGVDSIKFNAPKFRSSQNRAVTANDYAAVIKASNPNIESIAVWGGEENNPPTYGKVFIAIKPTTGYIITDSVKDFIKTSVLKEKKVMSIIPELVDPDYLYVNLNVDITYDKLITSLNAAKIQSLATGAIQVYFDNELEKFNKPLSFSKLFCKLLIKYIAIKKIHIIIFLSIIVDRKFLVVNIIAANANNAFEIVN